MALGEPLGLDGRYRLGSFRGLTTAGRTHRLPGGTVRIDLNLLASIGRYLLDLTMGSSTITIQVREPDDRAPTTTIRGRVSR